jgi:hypothetical protein
MKIFSTICFSLLVALSSFGQLAVSNDQTVSYYVQEIFQGPGVTVANVTINGFDGTQFSCEQVGQLHQDMGYLPFNEGIVMSTGAIISTDFAGDTVVVGNSPSVQTADTCNSYGDIDLETITGFNINDQAVIEFDLVTTEAFLSYQYVFASQEYPEWVNTNFNDAFGFFISGPGITGPYSSPAGFPDGSVNMAIVPGTADVPVAINSINMGGFNCGSASTDCVNCQYYINNCDSSATQFDGLTTTLIAQRQVTPGLVYHLKLAIGDAADGALDSGVFLKRESLVSFAQPLSVPEVESAPLSIYPNPVEDALTISAKFNGEVKLMVHDNFGRLIIESTESPADFLKLDCAELEMGAYTLTVQPTFGEPISKRFVKR